MAEHKSNAGIWLLAGGVAAALAYFATRPRSVPPPPPAPDPPIFPYAGTPAPITTPLPQQPPTITQPGRGVVAPPAPGVDSQITATPPSPTNLNELMVFIGRRVPSDSEMLQLLRFAGVSGGREWQWYGGLLQALSGTSPVLAQRMDEGSYISDDGRRLYIDPNVKYVWDRLRVQLR